MTRTEELSTTLPPEPVAGAGVEEPEEMLIEEISIDGMCGVY